MKEDFKLLADTYLSTRWVSGRNGDEICHKTEQVRQSYQRLLTAIEKGGSPIVKMTENLSLDLEVPYFIIRSVLRERYWNSNYFRGVLNSHSWPGIELCYLIQETLPNPIRIFGTVKMMRIYRGRAVDVARPCCAILDTRTLSGLPEALDKSIILITTQGHILDVGESPQALYEKYFEYFTKQYSILHRSLRWRDCCFGWLFGDCTGARAEISVHRNSPCLVLCSLSTDRATITLAKRYYDAASSVEQGLISRRLLANFLHQSPDRTLSAIFGESLLRGARSFRFKGHHLKPITTENSYYSELLDGFEPQSLADFIIESIRSKGYEYAVSFVIPLTSSKKISINPRFYIYFLSELIQSQCITKENIQDYSTQVLAKIKAIRDPSSQIYEEFQSVCDGIPQLPEKITDQSSSGQPSFLEAVLSSSSRTVGDHVYRRVPLVIRPDEIDDDRESLGEFAMEVFEGPNEVTPVFRNVDHVPDDQLDGTDDDLL